MDGRARPPGRDRGQARCRAADTAFSMPAPLQSAACAASSARWACTCRGTCPEAGAQGRRGRGGSGAGTSKGAACFLSAAAGAARVSGQGPCLPTGGSTGVCLQACFPLHPHHPDPHLPLWPCNKCPRVSHQVGGTRVRISTTHHLHAGGGTLQMKEMVRHLQQPDQQGLPYRNDLVGGKWCTGRYRGCIALDQAGGGRGRQLPFVPGSRLCLQGNARPRQRTSAACAGAASHLLRPPAPIVGVSRGRQHGSQPAQPALHGAADRPARPCQLARPLAAGGSSRRSSLHALAAACNCCWRQRCIASGDGLRRRPGVRFSQNMRCRPRMHLATSRARLATAALHRCRSRGTAGRRTAGLGTRKS